MNHLKEVSHSYLVHQRYRIFFLLEKFIFWHFWEKIEWVSKKVYFFFRGCIFFFRPFRTSEWVGSKLFLRKKKYTFLLGKKNTPQKCKNTFLQRGAAAQPSEWLSNYSWEKKIHLYFFSSRNAKKKIHDCPKTSEWVALNFSWEKKNTVPLSPYIFKYKISSIMRKNLVVLPWF